MDRRVDSISQADELFDQGYRVMDNRVYNRDHKLVSYDLIKAIPKEVLNALKKKQEYLFPNEKDIDVNAADKLPVECYNGKFYRDGKPYTDMEMINLIRELNSEFTWAQIQSTMKAATVLKAIPRLPEFNWNKGTAKPALYSDGQPFRFPKTVYQLLKHYMEDSRQDYILFIMSEGGQGKSTFTNFMKKLFRNEYYSADSRFMNNFTTASWASARLVVFSDCTNKFIDNSHILKQISGGDDVQIEGKGVQGYSGKLDCKLLFVGNEPLSYNIMDTGMQRRFINLPWEQNLKYRDPKWVDYEWSDDEIAWHLNEAKKVEPFDFEKLRDETIKESLQRKSAFYYTNYVLYKENEEMAYNRDNFNLFWKMVKKYYSSEEWNKIYHQKEEVKPYEVEGSTLGIRRGGRMETGVFQEQD